MDSEFFLALDEIERDKGISRDYMLEKIQVVGTPGAGFGANGTHYFRLTSFGSRENTVAAMVRFEKMMAEKR